MGYQAPKRPVSFFTLFISSSRSTITIISSSSSTPSPPRRSSKREYHQSSSSYAPYGPTHGDREGVDGRDIFSPEPLNLDRFHTSSIVLRPPWLLISPV